MRVSADGSRKKLFESVSETIVDWCDDPNALNEGIPV